MTVTLTQVLARQQVLQLYGQRVTDLTPRGSLGLPLDPDGPVGFALVRAVRRDGSLQPLQPPRLLSVHGDGSAPPPSDADALPGERIWTAGVLDTAVGLTVQMAPLQVLLDTAPSACAPAWGDAGAAAARPTS